MTAANELIENFTYDEIRMGQRAQMSRTLTRDDINAFALISGDVNPAHVDLDYAVGTRFHGIIAHGMWAGALISSVLGTDFPGAGTIYLEQSLRFHHPVHVGDTLTVSVEVLAKDEATFRFEVPAYSKPLLVTDAAINIAPGLEHKADIVRNAIDLAHALGIARPKVAILSAVESVTPRLSSTLDAAALCKMADRGQITDATLDGPLALDNAISANAARIKGIQSSVAGDADILVVPDLEAGNMLAKQLEYLAGASGCGVVLGASVPIALTSRADSAVSRRASAALAGLLARTRHRA